jgi:aspartate kinase
MRIVKFGGTSVGSAYHIKKLVNLIDTNKRTLFVFSAVGGITNLLVDFIYQSKLGEKEICDHSFLRIRDIHYKIIAELFSGKNYKQIAESKVEESLKIINYYKDHRITEKVEKEILAQGELMSCSIIYLYMLEQEMDVAYILALRFMFIDKYKEPDYSKISGKLEKELSKYNGCKLFITNGYICQNHKRQTDNLSRGGSDYTATIIGSVLQASIIEIWTDIDGLQNNDPRFVENTFPIRNLSYEEASELAYFGAKILHPLCIIPAQRTRVPIALKNTMSPEDQGTLISEFSVSKGIKAIAAKDGITSIKVKSGRMMQAYGFLRRIFEVFEKYKTAVDMLTTSEISVAMTIDNDSFLEPIVAELCNLGEVEIDQNQSIICIVGSFNEDRNLSIQQIVDGLGNIPVRMISFGASKINISFLIDTANKVEALNLLNQQIFRHQLCSANIQ